MVYDDDTSGHPHYDLEEPDYPGRYDGMPGLVWYASAQKVPGAELTVGQWLDSLDHRGARAIYSIDPSPPESPTRVVRFDGIRYGILEDSEVVRKDVMYDVVDPTSQVAPDGTPMGTQE